MDRNLYTNTKCTSADLYQLWRFAGNTFR